ncbi:hypothetical protein WJ542_29740 [Paraburkholderia sp. B3]|uniref:hypothetical protein n=1 Tax=Paraburkholderia sp. B3 TaxID=3134791 RepID=UPI0039827E3E
MNSAKPHSPAGSATTPPVEGTPPRSDAKPARGYPGSFDQPEPRPEAMPAEGGPHPEQTAEVPLGMHGHPEPPGARGHNSPPIRRKPGDKCTQ